MAYVSSLLVRIAPAWRRKLTSNMLLLVISRSFSNRLLVVTATKSRREETEETACADGPKELDFGHITAHHART